MITTRTSTDELWASVTTKLDMIDELRATRAAWEYAGQHDLVADADKAIAVELDKLAVATQAYNERVLTGI